MWICTIQVTDPAQHLRKAGYDLSDLCDLSDVYPAWTTWLKYLLPQPHPNPTTLTLSRVLAAIACGVLLRRKVTNNQQPNSQNFHGFVVHGFVVLRFRSVTVFWSLSRFHVSTPRTGHDLDLLDPSLPL